MNSHLPKRNVACRLTRSSILINRSIISSLTNRKWRAHRSFINQSRQDNSVRYFTFIPSDNHNYHFPLILLNIIASIWYLNVCLIVDIHFRSAKLTFWLPLNIGISSTLMFLMKMAMPTLALQFCLRFINNVLMHLH